MNTVSYMKSLIGERRLFLFTQIYSLLKLEAELVLPVMQLKSHMPLFIWLSIRLF